MTASSSEAAIDACVFHDWAGLADLAPYMEEGWRTALMRPGNADGPNAGGRSPLYRNPLGRREASVYPERGPAGSDLALTARHLLEDGLRERLVLGYGESGLLATAYTNPDVAQVLTRALNDWTRERWLDLDERLHALILVSTSIPSQAAEEIRRVGADPRFVGVALGTNGLDRPFGQPAYHPIYEAASELGLPVVLQAGCDTAPSLFAAPIAGGVASTYAETEIWAAHALMTHLSSLVLDGVLELFPDLRVMLVGGGVTWYPPHVWRLDAAWSHQRSESPLLREPPSHYLRRQVRLCTAGMELAAPAGRLETVLGALAGMEGTLVYGSGYPERGWVDPGQATARLPEEWGEAVLRGNALSFFRFPGPTAAAGLTPTREGGVP